MERLHSVESYGSGNTVYRYVNVQSYDLDNHRKKAVLYTSIRSISEEELKRIKNADNLPLIDLGFEGGLKLTRMTFPSGFIDELYRNGEASYRIFYDPKARIAITHLILKDNPIFSPKLA